MATDGPTNRRPGQSAWSQGIVPTSPDTDRRLRKELGLGRRDREPWPYRAFTVAFLVALIAVLLTKSPMPL